MAGRSYCEPPGRFRRGVGRYGPIRGDHWKARRLEDWRNSNPLSSEGPVTWRNRRLIGLPYDNTSAEISMGFIAAQFGLVTGAGSQV